MSAELPEGTDVTASSEAQARRALLRQRAQLLAAPVVSPRELVLAQDMLGFQIGPERYAVENRYVWRVLRDIPITQLPVADPKVLGLFSLQGELLLVFDLAHLLGAQRMDRRQAAAPAHSYLLVLGRDQPELAVAVDAFEGTEQLEAAGLLEPAAAHERDNAFVRGVTADARLVLDGATLLTDPRLYIDEAIGAAIGTRGEE